MDKRVRVCFGGRGMDFSPAAKKKAFIVIITLLSTYNRELCVFFSMKMCVLIKVEITKAWRQPSRDEETQCVALFGSGVDPLGMKRGLKMDAWTVV